MEQTITALVINRNRPVETERAIRSVKEQTYKNIEIVVWDNGKLNLGVALPSNITAKKSKAEYIFFIDNDAYLTVPNYIERLVWIMEEFDKCAFAFGRVTNVDGTDQWIEMFELSGYDVLQKCKSFNGCGVLIRKDVFLEVGGYNEQFFAYYLEPELASRFYSKGYFGMYCPVKLVHEQTPRERETGRVAYLLVRNGYLYHIKQREWGKVMRRFGWACFNCNPHTFIRAHIDMLKMVKKWI